MEGLVEVGEVQRENDLEAQRDAEASIPKDQMRGEFARRNYANSNEN